MEKLERYKVLAYTKAYRRSRKRIGRVEDNHLDREMGEIIITQNWLSYDLVMEMRDIRIKTNRIK